MTNWTHNYGIKRHDILHLTLDFMQKSFCFEHMIHFHIMLISDCDGILLSSVYLEKPTVENVCKWSTLRKSILCSYNVCFSLVYMNHRIVNDRLY